MQWLEVRARKAGFQSLRELARSAVDDPAWPDEISDNPDSLAAALSRINRGIGEAWLDRRPAAGQVLARLLGIGSYRDLLREAGDHAEPPPPAPAKDTSISLHPGIPGEIAAPDGWRRLWWHAPAGSGRAAAAAWLEKRVAVVRAASWADAVGRLPADGAAFVALADPVDVETLADGAPHPARLCVAASFAPPSDNWDLVVTPPVTEWRADLCAWAAPRLQRRFDLREALQLFHRRDRDGRVFDTPGAVLGVCELLDRHGARELARLDVDAWIRDAVQDAALARLLVERILDTGEAGWDQPRTRAGWEELVPHDVARPPDVERARRLLEQGKADGALEALQPGPAEAVQTLIEAGALEPVEPGRFALRPVWAFRLLEEAAVERRLDAARPGEWGALLLQPHLAADVMERVVARLRGKDWDFLDRAVGEVDPADPAAVAACEGVVRAAGLAVLEGRRPPAALRERLLQRQAALLFQPEADAPPGPRVDLESETDAPPVLRVGAWTLAVLALTEGLPRAKTRGLPACLAPWPFDAADALLEDTLWSVQRAVLDDQETPWTKAAFELVARLPAAPATVNPLVWPVHVASAFRAGNVDLLYKLASLWDVPSGSIDFVDELARRRGMAWRHVARLIWLAWRHAEERFVPELLRHDGPDAPQVWRAIPRAALLYLLHQDWPIAFDHLGVRQWRVVFADRLQVYRPKWPVPWARAPKKAVTWAARKGMLANADLDVLRELWTGHAAILQAACATALETGDLATARALLQAAPAVATPDLVDALAAHPVDDETVRAWLYDRVTRRAPGWRRAFAML